MLAMNAETAPIEETPFEDHALATGIAEVRGYFDGGNYIDALEACERLLARHPNDAEPLLLLGLISFEIEEPKQATALLLQAHERAPRVREYADALASTYAQLGEQTEGLYYAKLAAILPPHPLGSALLPEHYSRFFQSLSNAQPHLFRNRAQRLLDQGDAPSAFAACEKQLELSPQDNDTWRLLARAALETGNIDAVLSACEHLRDEPLSATDYDVLARALAKVGDFADAEQAHQNAIESEPENPAFAQSRIRTLAARYGNTGGHLERENKAWVERYSKIAGEPGESPPPNRNADRPLRIAYVGGELHSGPLAEVLTPILAAHDPKRVYAFCYAANKRHDTSSESMANLCVRWTDIHDIDPVTVAEILRGDGIDIAVDLSGHGPDSQLCAFAQKPAPICVSWLGGALPAGTGFDYLLASKTLAPAVEQAGGTAAAIYQLPGTHLAYRPMDAPQTVSPLPAESQPHVTIGVMAPLAELGESCIRDWADILSAIPDARIVVANVEQLEGAAINLIYEMAAAVGIRDRVDIADLEDLDPSGYGFFNHFDVLLDPQPNSRFLETCRALWMGVPVVAVAGDGYLGRQAATALAGANRQEWVFANAKERIAGLRKLIADVGQLADIRRSLRAELEATPLYDVSGFTRDLEAAYHAM